MTKTHFDVPASELLDLGNSSGNERSAADRGSPQTASGSEPLGTGPRRRTVESSSAADRASAERI